MTRPSRSPRPTIGPAIGAICSAITGVLKYPNPGCDLPLWNAWGTYHHAVYACEYGTGDMWRFDPRMGGMQRVGPTGVGGWGLAYDSDRDVLYGMVVVSIDPSSGAASTLPGPIGFNVGATATSPGTPTTRRSTSWTCPPAPIT